MRACVRACVQLPQLRFVATKIVVVTSPSEGSIFFFFCGATNSRKVVPPSTPPRGLFVCYPPLILTLCWAESPKPMGRGRGWVCGGREVREAAGGGGSTDPLTSHPFLGRGEGRKYRSTPPQETGIGRSGTGNPWENMQPQE